MDKWLSGVSTGFTGWLGGGISSLLSWLFRGLVTVLTKVINAAQGFWDILESIWNFAIGFIELIFRLLCICFPFIPPAVLSVIYLGLIAVLIAGIIKKVGAK